MIKVENGCAEIEGALPTILTELSGAIEAVYEGIAKEYDKELAKQEIDRAYELAFATEEELEKIALEETKKLLEKIKGLDSEEEEEIREILEKLKREKGEGDD